MDGKERTIDKLRAEMEKYKVTQLLMVVLVDAVVFKQKSKKLCT